ncbi:MobF family relaxase [Streptosporangium sp. NPDC050284]|uniref:MobF family relaxase n=1 Tax=Streptosporangium sp. NPDC050284 TaxID=3366193 RepID=UPI00379360BA
MAWVSTLGPSMAQVDYRLQEGAGCQSHHLVRGQEDGQISYRLAGDRPLMWIGDGLREVGLTPGTPLTADQHEMARALMDGRHPHTGQVLMEAKRAVDPRAMLPGGPLLTALEKAAAERGVADVAALVAGNEEMAKRAVRLQRGVRRKGEAYVIPYDDARRLAKAAGLDLAAVYDADQLAEARRWREARVRVGNRGYDLTLDLAKSVSVLHGLGDAAVSAVVDEEFTASVIETVDAVQGWVAYGQRGHQGDGRLAGRAATGGLLGWVMWHQTARPVDGQVPDPHLHAHVQIANMVRGVDGKWSAIAAGGKDLHRHAHAADAFLKARLRRRLTEELGLRWERDAHTGAWEIVGIDETMRTRFSKRDGQIKELLAEHGLAYDEAHPHARKVASATSRQAKHQLLDGDRRGDWHAQCAADGVDAAAVMTSCLHPGEGLPPRPGAQQIAEWIWRPGSGLTAHTKTVSHADVLAAVADACPDGVADLADLQVLTDAVLTHKPAVRLAEAGARHLVNSARYTSTDILEAEQQVLHLTRQRYTEGAAVLDTAAIALSREAFEVAHSVTFSPSQRAVLERLLGDGHGVDALIGVPGAGKTMLMAAARAGWESRGLVVAGAATAAVAAANLTAESGIGAYTFATWMQRITDPEGPGGRGLDGVDVLVIDEAAMVDDRDLAVVLGEAHRTGTKVVAIGDPLQLRAIGVGGTFAALHRQVDGLVLSENRRQRDPIERQALAQWRDGDRTEALRTWSRGGRVHAGRDATDTLGALLAHWATVRTGYRDDVHGELAAVLVLAGSNAEAERLNAAARAIRRAAGELAGPDVRYRLPGGRTLELAVGDHVRVRANDYRSRKSKGRRADVLNGYRGIVTAIHRDRSVSVQWRRLGADGPAPVVERVTPAYIAAGGLSHGTAMTVAAAQGLTSHHTLIYGMGLDPHTLYAAMSRDRLSAHLYLPRNVLESDADRARHGEPRNAAEELHRALDAYAATLHGDRADDLLTPEPEPIAAVRARELATIEAEATQVVTQARELAAIKAEAARVVAARVALNEVTRPDRPHGLLSDVALHARIETIAAQATTLAQQVAQQRCNEREEAEQIAAIRVQVKTELVDERDRLAHALDQARTAGDRRHDARGTYQRVQQRVARLQAALAEKNSGLRALLPSSQRTRLQEKLQEASQAMTRAARRAEAAARVEQAALHAARQASPSCTSAADLQTRHRLLTGSTSFAKVLNKTIADRVEQVMPGLANRKRVAAARLSFHTIADSPAGQRERATRLLASLVAERDHRGQLSEDVRRGQDRARQDPAAAKRVRTRNEQARARTEAQQRKAAQAAQAAQAAERTYSRRPPTARGPGPGLRM